MTKSTNKHLYMSASGSYLTDKQGEILLGSKHTHKKCAFVLSGVQKGHRVSRKYSLGSSMDLVRTLMFQSYDHTNQNI